MLRWGDEARAEVFVLWGETGAHVFVAENVGGAVYFVDPHINAEDAGFRFD